MRICCALGQKELPGTFRMRMMGLGCMLSGISLNCSHSCGACASLLCSCMDCG